jgi:6-methylsalicylate decarboxylase
VVRVDVHQHVWTKSLIDALAARGSPPRIVVAGGEAILESVGEPCYVIDVAAESPARRLELVDRDGLDVAIVALSSPTGIEALRRDEAGAVIDAHLDGVQALGPRFAAWGPIGLDQPAPDDVDRLLDRGCVGISIPAGALATPDRLTPMASVLERIADRGVPLFVHPGPAPADVAAARQSRGFAAGADWWTPVTSYVSQMQSAWLSFCALGRPEHPRLIALFAMLAGGAPLLSERLSARGGPPVDLRDPLTFYDTSSFGPFAVEAMARRVGEVQLIYGSDRPVVEPALGGSDVWLQESAGRLLSAIEFPA